MLYGALAAGVKGVLYYTFYDGTDIKGHLTLNQQNPALWDEIGKQAKEITQLAPFLLKGTRRALPSNAKHDAAKGLLQQPIGAIVFCPVVEPGTVAARRRRLRVKTRRTDRHSRKKRPSASAENEGSRPRSNMGPAAQNRGS